MHYRIQIPAFNEEHTIRDVILRSISSVTELVRDSDKVSVLVINDGSTDGTAPIVRGLARGDSRIELIDNPGNRGLGASFVQGIEHAIRENVDMMIHIDGDGQFDPVDIPTLTAPVLAGEADLVLGSRFAGSRPPHTMSFPRMWGNRFLSRVVTLLTGKRILDVSCGFRVFSRRALDRLHVTSRFTYTHQSILACAYSNVSIVEVPIEIRPNREYGEAKISANIWRYGLLSSGSILNCVRVFKPVPFYAATLLLFLTVAGMFWR